LKCEVFIFSFNFEGTPASLILFYEVLKNKHQTATKLINKISWGWKPCYSMIFSLKWSLLEQSIRFMP